MVERVWIATSDYTKSNLCSMILAFESETNDDHDWHRDVAYVYWYNDNQCCSSFPFTK